MWFAPHRSYERCSMPLPSFTTAAASVRISMQHVTQHLVSQLQAGFPNTVHNILRTSLKLQQPTPIAVPVAAAAQQMEAQAQTAAEQSQVEAALCPLCAALLTPQELMHLQSTQRSSDGVCYACRRILNDISKQGVELFPSQLTSVESIYAQTSAAPHTETAAHEEDVLDAFPDTTKQKVYKLSRSDMRAVLGDCLLDSESEHD